jgi:nicotinate phosphoribosyltransferase
LLIYLEVLGIALTDTFGTRNFLKAFKQPVGSDEQKRSYAEVFAGVRQDSGDPAEFVETVSKFYEEQGIKKKSIVFSDSLDVEKCLHYKAVSEEHGLVPSFGVGTFLTSKSNELKRIFLMSRTDDFKNTETSKKSVPLNIVIKIASADGNPAVKISDNIGKNTGDKATVEDVKRRLGYIENEWADGDESHRWG